MISRRGFELAISTIVILVVAIAVLIGMIIFVKKGFGWFDSGTRPVAGSAEIAAVKQGCGLACRSGNSFTFCCENFTLQRPVLKQVKCSGEIIGAVCQGIDCSTVSCAPLT